MPLVAFPVIRAPKIVTIGQLPLAYAHGSPESGVLQTSEVIGTPWKMVWSWAHLGVIDSGRIRAYCAAMRGRAGRSELPCEALPEPLGTLRGAPVVDGANQTGAALAIRSATPGGTLLAGDLFGLGGRWRMVTADAVVAGNGKATLAIEPPITTAPANGALITLVRPTATFYLNASSWDQSFGAPAGRRQTNGMQLEFIEDLGATT